MIQLPRHSIVLVALVVCGALPSAWADPSPKSLLLVGSTTLTPLVKATAGPFYLQTHIRVLARPRGSARGVLAAAQGDAALGVASRDFSDQEGARWPMLEQVTVARDALGFYVNAANPVDDLSVAQIQDIYTGRLTKWRSLWTQSPAPSWKDSTIEVVTKNVGHGTLEAFIALFGLDEDVRIVGGRQHFKRKDDTAFTDWLGAKPVDRFNESVGEVTHRPDSIAYDSIGAMYALGNRTAQIKLVKVGGVLPSLESVQQG